MCWSPYFHCYVLDGWLAHSLLIVLSSLFIFSGVDLAVHRFNPVRYFLFVSAPTLIVCLSFPVDTGRKLNVHKTFRSRPERLLNVLYTFILRPVPTGFLGGTFFLDHYSEYLWYRLFKCRPNSLECIPNIVDTPA